MVNIINWINWRYYNLSTLMDVKEYICDNNMDMALQAIDSLQNDETQIGNVVKSKILVA